MRLVALCLGLALALSPVPAAAGHDSYYGDTARSVAKHLGCKKFTGKGAGDFHVDSGACRLKGKRVKVLTFIEHGQQGDWNAIARHSFGPEHFWANGAGAVVVARDGNRAAARLGARRLPGVVRHG